MPKATLEYSLPEETEEYELAIKGHEYKMVIDDFQQELRKIIKYSDPKNAKERLYIKHVENIRDMLFDLLKERDL